MASHAHRALIHQQSHCSRFPLTMCIVKLLCHFLHSTLTVCYVCPVNMDTYELPLTNVYVYRGDRMRKAPHHTKRRGPRAAWLSLAALNILGFSLRPRTLCRHNECNCRLLQLQFVLLCLHALIMSVLKAWRAEAFRAATKRECPRAARQALV